MIPSSVIVFVNFLVSAHIVESDCEFVFGYKFPLIILTLLLSVAMISIMFFLNMFVDNKSILF